MSSKETGSAEQAVDERSLASSFNQEANFYDKFRMGYPDQLFSTIDERLELTELSNILEIGCGAGQATVPLAARGYNLTAVEPGDALARVTAEKITKNPKARVIVSSFENAQLPSENYDLVLAAMSLHWVNEDVRFSKPADLLKTGGRLAILYNWPLFTKTDAPFYDSLNTLARTHQMEGSLVPIREDELTIHPWIEDKYFDTPEFFTLKTRHAFDSGLAYAGFLATLSAVSVTPEPNRSNFLTDVAALIRADYGDSLALSYISTLALARKK
ncbi:MAG: class I SAM-dependent methyltransferase [Patescibacteria group bacterium]|nr:class I SAM-dependent methyltransferase [Patescibacteria group bacterium]